MTNMLWVKVLFTTAVLSVVSLCCFYKLIYSGNADPIPSPPSAYCTLKHAHASPELIFVLVHGLEGSSENTFTSHSKDNDDDDVRLDDLLFTAFPKSVVIGYDYPNPATKLSWQTPTQLKERAKSFLVDVANVISGTRSNRPGARSDVIIFIAHSMGGLVVKHALVMAAAHGDEHIVDIYKQTKGVVFYATPHRGSFLANILNLVPFVPTTAIGDLEMADSKSYLHRNFADIVTHQNIRILSLVETQVECWYVGCIVSVMSSACDFGNKTETIRYLPFSHTEICKPSDRFDVRFHSLETFVLGVDAQIAMQQTQAKAAKEKAAKTAKEKRAIEAQAAAAETQAAAAKAQAAAAETQAAAAVKAVQDAESKAKNVSIAGVVGIALVCCGCLKMKTIIDAQRNEIKKLNAKGVCVIL